MKIDENGVLLEVDENDVVDGILTIPEGVKKIDWEIDSRYTTYYIRQSDGSAKEMTNVTELVAKIELPSTLVQIGGTGFNGFEKLESIDIPDSVTEITKDAFRDCTQLKHASLSRNLEKIPDKCFSGCKSLKAVVIPDSVKELGDNIFAGCENLECMYLSKNIEKMYDSSLKIIKRDQYGNYDSHKLKEVVFPESQKSLYSFLTHDSDLPKADKMVLPENLDYATTDLKSEFVFRTERGKHNWIANNSKKTHDYKNNFDLKNAAVEGNPIYRKKLEMLDVAKNKRNKLTRITIEKTDVIGEYAFAECENLEEVVIGKGVKSIERGAFAFCPNLKRVIILSKELENIGNDAFRECTSLGALEINSDVTRIGDRAFYDCSSLVTVNMNENVGSIGKEAFLGCENLLGVYMPKKLKSIGDRAFKDCTKMNSIHIPNGVEEIGESAFENCCSEKNYIEIPKVVGDSGKTEWSREELPSAVEVVRVPKTVKHIGKSAFSGCKNILYMHFEDDCQLENIEENTFSGCEGLEQINIPKNLKSIKDNAFSNCKSLTNIELPHGFEEIGSKSFKNCESLSLLLTNGEVKRKSDSFLNANNVNEANVNDFNIKTKNVKGKEYEVIRPPKKNIGKVALSSINKALSIFKKKDKER